MALLLLDATSAHAQRRTSRRRFEPTDLDMKGGAGVIALDVQGGVIQGDQTRRVITPDIEAAFGLSAFAQLQIDTSLGFDQDTGEKLVFLENTWTSLKLGIVDEVHPVTKHAWAGGVQVGPKLPTAYGAHGPGFEGVAIAGRSAGGIHLFAQAGFVLEPFLSTLDFARYRPFGVEGGFDLDLDLDSNDRWSLKSELGGTRYFQPRVFEIHLTAGVGFKVVPWLELTALIVSGVGQGDRFGGLVGVAPRFDVIK